MDTADMGNDAAAGAARATLASPGTAATGPAAGTPVGTEAAADTPGPRAARWSRRLRRLSRHPRLYLGALTVMAAALAAVTGLLAATLQGSSDAARQRAAVLAAARQEAVSLTTLDRRTASRDYAAVLAGAAGSLRQQLSQGRSTFLRTLSTSRVSSAGTVLDAGVVTMTSRSATVLLNVRATVRNKRTYAPETRLYHWRAGLVYSGGRWLVTSLGFA